MNLNNHYTHVLMGSTLGIGIALCITISYAYAEETEQQVATTDTSYQSKQPEHFSITIEEAKLPWGQRYAPTRNMLELGVFGGILLPASQHELYRSDLDIEHQDFRKVAPNFGLRLGYYPASFLGIEAEGAVMPTQTQGGNIATIYGFRGYILAQIPYRITPFALVGYGLLGQVGETLGSDVDPAFHFGGGLKIFVNRDIALRIDARDNLAPRYGDDNRRTHHVEVLAGVSVALNRPKPKKRVYLYVDTDGDGIYDPDQGLDLEDRCIHERGPAENQGCPMPQDQDRDGFIDSQDACPTEAGVQPDGCPLRDTDNDGILDRDDRCPAQPETMNNFEDRDGCPDEAPDPVGQLGNFIGTVQGIFFDVNQDLLLPESMAVLDQTVVALKEYPDTRIEISGHTDSEGDYDYNVDLSKRRADAVKLYLVEHGIDENRLVTVGYGPDKPIADNSTEDGRAQNRRIEFRLLGDQ